ncbi:hypothetical protein [Amycolatopsis jiangsuensis]|uniref:Uncharacterized protein n=1 Tax=Amycolatopsis jiangsuensis TaxID=1181879 RepID=A0A840IXN1_9PSEU|nr:hypothetical protein [Amycolatopsis jiangsuensis]MBB4687396.1 hypothetical protein [Amycolatopsis jiangsuensis]
MIHLIPKLNTRVRFPSSAPRIARADIQVRVFSFPTRIPPGQTGVVAIQYQPDISPAEWLVRADTPEFQKIAFGPGGYGAYARLRFIPDPVRDGQHETDVRVPEGHASEIEQARRALRVLGRFTSASDECYFCVWEGYSDVRLPPEAREGGVVLPYRRDALFRGSLSDLDGWEDVFNGGHPPAFVWPGDRRWCFASDVDPHWAGIGGAAEAMEALLGEPGIDVVRARPDETQPYYQ